MKKTTKLKAFALSVAMAFGMLLPNAAFAQSDDFFRSAVGAGYAVARRKRHNGIKAIIIITALIGVTSCRKNLDTVNEAAQHGVYITLNVDGGEKVAVNPTGGGTYATVTWENGDILYVGNNGAYCGCLTYDESTSKFGGTINPTSADDGDYLHFYFMGNKGTTSEPTSVNITDQTSKYPVISYGRSESLYNTGTTEYSATLYNKCAIVKFPISGAGTAENITLRGMNNTVTVNFAANKGATTGNPYTFSKTGYGEITLHAESATEKWAIVLPQDAVGAELYADGYKTVTVSVPDIDANTYHVNDISEITLTAGEPSDLFSVADDTKVRFSPGNLQYKPSNKSWQFAAQQHGIIGDANSNISPSYDGWLDLFGWGTGDDPTKGYDDYSYNKTFNDWGNYCGDPTGNGYHWRTLSTAEWQYLFNSRQTGKTVNDTENARYTEATINTNGTGVNGIILFPDSYSGPISSVDGITFGTINDVSSWGTRCTTDGWATLESAGCVFLPAAGYRICATVYNAGSFGTFWSSSFSNDGDGAYSVYFDSVGVDPQYNDLRFIGYSVRLARVVE